MLVVLGFGLVSAMFISPVLWFCDLILEVTMPLSHFAVIQCSTGYWGIASVLILFKSTHSEQEV